MERAAQKKGFSRIAGVDEVGRGSLAGPVVACACFYDGKIIIEGVDDSKKLSCEKRGKIFQALLLAGVQYGIGVVDHDVIDAINIYQATLMAMKRAISNLPTKPDFLLVDGMPILDLEYPVKKIIGGDALCYCIAAASIIAKETRDAMMREFGTKWPHYGFDQNKGYGTVKHIEAIKNFGITPIHRKSFSPCFNSYYAQN